MSQTAPRTPTEAELAALFAGAENAPGIKLPFLPVGTHVVDIDSIEPFQGQVDGLPGVRATVEVVETDSAETKVGNKHTILHKKTNPKYNYWLGEVLGLVAAAQGKKTNEVNGQSMAAFIVAYPKMVEDPEIGKCRIKVQVTKEAKGDKSFFKSAYFAV